MTAELKVLNVSEQEKEKCDETEMESLRGGKAVRVPRYNGGYFKLSCEANHTMSGSSAVYCDGRGWNGSKPLCIGRGDLNHTLVN